MSKQDKSSRKTGAGDPSKAKPKNPGLEVVNIYGSGPLPVGLRGEPEPQAEDPAREAEAAGENRGALSTSEQGSTPKPGSPTETKP